MIADTVKGGTEGFCTTPASQPPPPQKKGGEQPKQQEPMAGTLRKCDRDAEGGSPQLMASGGGAGGDRLSSTKGAGSSECMGNTEWTCF